MRTVSPFDALAVYSSPAYVSMDQPRAATLVYTGAQAQARAYVQVDAVDRSTVVPSRMSIQVLDAAGAAATAETFYHAGSGANRLAADWRPGSLPTGAYTYQVVVRTYWDRPGRTVVRQAARPVRVLLLNEKRSRLGHGWSLAGLQRLHFRGDSAMVANGDGSAAFFRRASATTFDSPEGEWSRLRVADSLYVRRWPDGTEATFSANGFLKQVQDRFGRRTSFHYTATTDGIVVPARIVDPAGKEIVFTYRYGSFLGTITTPGGRASTVWYTGEKIHQVVAPDGVVELQATYDVQDRMRTRKDRDGGTYGFAYDAAGFVSADSLPAATVEGGATQRPVVRQSGWESAFLPPPGTGTAAAPAPRVDPAAVRARVTDPRGATTAVAFDRHLLPTRVEAPLGDTTLVFRDAHGRPWSVHLPTGAVTQYQYEGTGPGPTRVWESDGDSDGENEVVTTIEYGAPFDLPERVLRGGVETVYAYGAQGHLLTATVGGYATTFGYTADGRAAWVEEPGGRRTDLAYDTAGFRNLREVRDADSDGSVRKVTSTFDAYGRTAGVTDAAGTVQIRYDLLNRDTLVADPAGTTRMAYQGSRLWKVTDAAGKAYTFNTNVLGWLQSQVDPNGRTTSYGHDVGGNVVRATDRRGLSVTFTHDSLGRVRTRIAGADTTHYAYGPDNRWIAASNAVSRDTVKFDERGRKVEEKSVLRGLAPDSVFARTSRWHDEGPRRQLLYGRPGGTQGRMDYAYDNALQLTGLLAFNAWSELRYNPSGLLDTLVLRPGGPIASYQYSTANLLTQARWSVPALDTKLGARYGWDELDRLGIRENAAGSTQRRYHYDAVSRLTGFSANVASQGPLVCDDPSQPGTCYRPLVWSQTDTADYAYDAVGNRTDAGAALQAGSNRYQTFRGYTFEYDLAGNVTRKYNAQYDQVLAWDALGRLASVTTNGVTVTYGYNGFGQRVKRTVGGTVTYSVYDGDDLLMELGGSGALVREYAHYPGVDQPHSMRDASGNVYYYSLEYPGHVNGVFSAANQVVNEYRYTPWGEVEAQTENVQQPLRYMARELDPITGLYYVRNRWYDPVAARFVSEDPIGLAGGINLYAYVGNSPMNVTDPFGLKPGRCKLVFAFKYYKDTREVVPGSIRFLRAEGDCSGPPALDGSDSLLTGLEMDRLQCVGKHWLSPRAGSIFIGMLKNRQVVTGLRTPPAQAWMDPYIGHPMIVFSRGVRGGAIGFSVPMLAFVAAHEVGHVEQVHRMGVAALGAIMSGTNEGSRRMQDELEDKADRYAESNRRRAPGLGAQCPASFVQFTLPGGGQ